LQRCVTEHLLHDIHRHLVGHRLGAKGVAAMSPET
jgi:hypothetical protein